MSYQLFTSLNIFSLVPILSQVINQIKLITVLGLNFNPRVAIAIPFLDEDRTLLQMWHLYLKV